MQIAQKVFQKTTFTSMYVNNSHIFTEQLLRWLVFPLRDLMALWILERNKHEIQSEQNPYCGLLESRYFIFLLLNEFDLIVQEKQVV